MAKKAKRTGPLPVRAGVAVGIVWAAAVLLIGIMANFGYATEWVTLLASIYKGYKSTCITGILLGVVYGFIDGFIGGFVVIWLYNKLKINK